MYAYNHNCNYWNYFCNRLWNHECVFKCLVYSVKVKNVLFPNNLMTDYVHGWIKRRNEMQVEYDAEFNDTKNLREQCLLMTNFVESCVKDLLELKLESKTCRTIPLDKIIDVLKELKIINDNTGRDVRLFQKIRGHVAHKIKKSTLEKNINHEINLMHVRKIIAKNDHLHNTHPLEEQVFVIHLYLKHFLSEAVNLVI